MRERRGVSPPVQLGFYRRAYAAPLAHHLLRQYDILPQSHAITRKAVAVARLFSRLAPILIAIVFAVPAPAPAAPPESLAKKFDAVIDGPDYKHATWAAFVVDAKTGETVYARNPDS